MLKTKKIKRIFVGIILVACLAIGAMIAILPDRGVEYVSDTTYEYVLNHYTYQESGFYIARSSSDSDGEYNLYCAVSFGRMRQLADLGFSPSYQVINDYFYYLYGGKLYTIKMTKPYDKSALSITLECALEKILEYDSDWMYCEATAWGVVDGKQQRVTIYVAIKLDGSEWKEIAQDDIP